jgi:hypothetical protein
MSLHTMMKANNYKEQGRSEWTYGVCMQAFDFWLLRQLRQCNAAKLNFPPFCFPPKFCWGTFVANPNPKTGGRPWRWRRRQCLRSNQGSRPHKN